MVPETLYLCKTTQATVWTTFAGIIVAVAGARLFRLLYWLYRGPRPEHNQQNHGKTPEKIIFEEFQQWRRERNDGQIKLPVGSEYDLEIRRRVGRRQIKGVSVAVKVGLMSLSYAGILLCGTFAGNSATDSRALSSHPSCGVYSYGDDALKQGLFSMDKEVQAMHLVDECFKPETDFPNGCNYSMNTSVNYHTSPTHCPFVDPTMCLDNGAHAIRFWTDLIDARSLGINSPKKAGIFRETTCSPLTLNLSLVTPKIHLGLPWALYHYGPCISFNTSWTLAASLEEPRVPGSLYDVR